MTLLKRLWLRLSGAPERSAAIELRDFNQMAAEFAKINGELLKAQELP